MTMIFSNPTKASTTILLAIVGLVVTASYLNADSRGDELAAWIDQKGIEVYGELPELCDDLTFARRIYLDTIGRIPSLSELRDFQANGDSRRRQLIHELVFGDGERGALYQRLVSSHLARQWRRVLIPPGTTVNGAPETIEPWLNESFEQNKPLDEIMRELVRSSPNNPANAYFNLIGADAANYAGHVSRVMLGVRIECAQCHDHPFAPWKQQDFWGLAAFYSDLGMNRSTEDAGVGTIESDGVQYTAKYLWTTNPAFSDPVTGQPPSSNRSVSGTEVRLKLARWITARENPHFSSTMVNRMWQQLVGRGIYADVENLDSASPENRVLLDALGDKFAEIEFDTRVLLAAILKSKWYQAKSLEFELLARPDQFARSLKASSPEQVFDSLETSLHLPLSRINPSSARWSGDRLQLVSRLNETSGVTPEDYASGIPQALMFMNGKLTSDAIDWETSRLLRAVVEAPFLDEDARLDSLFLSVLTRLPTEAERSALTTYLLDFDNDSSKRRAYGEVLWALLNSPEFVLCR
ncbi:DUF1553 domain-containing protein [Pirellulaceae bacterium SH449]